MYRLGRFFVMLLVVTSAAAQLPHPDHIVIVIEENKGYEDVIGSPDAPYLNELVTRGALLTASYGLHHPSQPNYVELFSGGEHGVCNDRCHRQLITAPNLAKSLVDAGKTFIGYAENLTNECTEDLFVRRHCPWLDFNGIDSSASLDFKSFPKTPDGFKNELPVVAIVIPNLVDDMHSPSSSIKRHPHQSDISNEVGNGDQWLKDHLDAYATWAVANNSLLIITWDEDSSSYRYPLSCKRGITTDPRKKQNHIPTLLIGAHVIPGSTSTMVVTHYNVLRTILDMENLPPLGGSAAAQAITGIWQ
jgi:acid phosphatase